MHSKLFLCLLFITFNGCKVRYGFKIVNLPENIKSIAVEDVVATGGNAPPSYIADVPIFLQQCLTSKLGLNNASPQTADLVIKCTITNYSIQGVGIEYGDKPSTNRLNISYIVEATSTKNEKINKRKNLDLWVDFSRDVFFQDVENQLHQKINQNLCEDIAWKVINEW